METKKAHDLASTVLTQAKKSPAPTEHSTKASRSELPEPYVEKLFARMSAIYGHKFNSLFRDEKALKLGKREWSTALAPLSDKQIGRGIQASRYLSDWNPNIPEFVRKACNLPDVHQCAARVIKRNNIDLVSYKITALIGSHNLKTLSDLNIKKMVMGYYEDAYAEVLATVIGRDDVFVPKPAIEEQDQEEATYADEGTVRPELEKMKQITRRASNG